MEKPPFASGVIAGDYAPLFSYWRLARSRGREDLVEASMLKEDDYRFLRELISSGVYNLEELLDVLTRRFEGRVDSSIARDAYKTVGLELDASVAKRRIAWLLAAWLLEAGETWGILRLRPSWREE